MGYPLSFYEGVQKNKQTRFIINKVSEFHLLLKVQSLKEWWIPPDFLIYVLVCIVQSTKNTKTNDIPLKSPRKLQKEMQKKILNFPKFVRFLGHFLKKQCFWKMGVAGIKQLPRPSKIASFSW